MLSKIVLKNFKSFKNRTEIDFTKTNYKFLDTNVASNGVLKGVMFVGANASGKSNIILAVKLLLDLLFEERQINSRIYLCLFCKEKEYSIEYHFTIEENIIVYSLSHDPFKRVLCEKLYLNNNLLCDRMGLIAKSYITGKEKTFDDLNKDTLFLRSLYFNTGFAENEILKKWFKFLQNSAYINPYFQSVVSYGKADLSLLNFLEKKGTDDINEFFDKYNFEQNILYSQEEGINKNIKITTLNENKMIFFNRKGVKDISIPFMEESLGNRTLLDILPAFLSLANNNGILLADEFSSGFHNELEELLIKYFMKTSKLSQILFVSHSTNLISTSVLRPDQIYSVNFNGSEGSWLKRFSDEQPRLAQNMEKMYLSGVFQGLPDYENQ